MLHRLYYHVVWTTRDRAPLIDSGLAAFLCRFLRGVARQEGAHVLEIGLVTTHVHLLLRANQTTDLVRLMQRLKGGSSAIAGKERHSTTGVTLKWSKGYAIHTVSPRGIEAVRSYLRQQPERHPPEAILGWAGDQPEFEIVERGEWVGPGRERI